MSLKCNVGLHEWKRYYIHKDSCEVQERCEQCGSPRGTPSVIHKWQWNQESPCRKSQVCTHCGVTGQVQELPHRWTTIYKPDSYAIQETCDLCKTARSRASAFAAFRGQDALRHSLFTLVAAAHQKGEALHHLLLCGQTGMGKATLAQILALEMGVTLKIASGKSLDKPGDLAAILTGVRAGGLILIEQLESLRKQVLECLIPAMNDFALDVLVGKGPSAREIRLNLPRFTLVGTTSKVSHVDERLKTLMLPFTLATYDAVDIAKIIYASAEQQGIPIDAGTADLLAKHSAASPAEGLRALKKVHDYAVAYSNGRITQETAAQAMAVFTPQHELLLYGRQGIPDDVKLFVWKRDGGRCVKCGSQENLEYDHIIPVSRGGSNTARNIQLLCESHNRAKGSNII